MKPELNRFITKNMIKYTENLRAVSIAQSKVEKALKLANFPPPLSLDRVLEILDVLDYIIKDSYKEAKNNYDKTKKIEKEYLRVSGFLMDAFADRAFEKFNESHLKLCESYIGLEKRIKEEQKEEFKPKKKIKTKEEIREPIYPFYTFYKVRK